VRDGPCHAISYRRVARIHQHKWAEIRCHCHAQAERYAGFLAEMAGRAGVAIERLIRPKAGTIGARR
jgi:hypothetical protein